MPDEMSTHPPNAYRSHHCADIADFPAGEHVRLAGWLAAKRNHGKILFVDLRDASGTVQLVCDADSVTREVLSRLRPESVITVSGVVVERSPETVNPGLLTGKVEVVVASCSVLSSAAALPFPVSKDVDVSEEQRLRYRYLDMRRGPLLERLRTRAHVAQLTREHLLGRGFLEVQTPVLTASSPEGARDFLVPSRLHPGEFYALPQAPQQFKQLLMIGGVERYFQIAPCFRDEDARADRSPGEFYQIDLEMAFATQEDVFAEVEPLMVRLFESVSGSAVAHPFPRLTYADAIARYGTDKPDLRLGCEIADLTVELSASTELPLFNSATSEGDVIRLLRARQGASRSRRFYEGFSDDLKAKGLKASWLVLTGAELRGPLAKWLDETSVGLITAATGAQEGDSVLVAVGSAMEASRALGAWRTTLGRELDPEGGQRYALCWIVDFPMFEWDEEDKQWAFSHNPFSMPQGGLEALRTKDPGDVLAYQYDLVCNGVELSSGAVRNHLPEVMLEAFDIAGYGSETVRQTFPALWNAFHLGAPPHAGIAPGFDRIVMLLEEQSNIREVIAFPLNQSARDLLMGAPSPVQPQQLRELHLRLEPGLETGPPGGPIPPVQD
jgi:aspartyl-tRNA synthetase